MAESFRMIYLLDGGQISGEDLEWQKLMDELNDVEVSKGVLGCLDKRHHYDEGHFLTTTMVQKNMMEQTN